MPIQAPQWTDYLNCPACCREFAPPRSPISLGCGHTLCRLCLKNLHRKQCPFDQTVITVDLEELVVNTALLQLAGFTPPAQPYHPPCIQALSDPDKHGYDVIVKCLEQLAVFLKHSSVNMMGSRLSRPMQRKLVTLLQCAMTDEEGRGKAARAARSLGERTVTELILQHQNPQQLSANLWAAVRARGCQFLGPAMQEEVLKLVLLALEDGSALSRKVLVMFVVQRLEPHFPQASKTSIGHVVQLLYRASCFKVSKRECDSSLMQLKEEFRTYESLRREHDAQIVQIATEAGLRIAPDQWSALLYGDTQHKSHMQSIIDKLQTPQSFAQSVQELFIALQRTGDPAQLIVMSIPLDRLASIDSSPDAKSPTWQQLAEIMTSLKDVVSGLVQYLQYQFANRDANHNPKIMERLPEPPTQPTSMQPGGVLPGKYKVAMCRDARARTYCPRGNNCTYAHSEEELERFRRFNHVVNNGNYPPYLMPVPIPAAVPVVRPIYQRFTVPPPSLPNMENYNMPAIQPISPSPRHSVIGADASERDERETSYEHPAPNVAADNFVASYANALIHGTGEAMTGPVGPTNQNQGQNGVNINTMLPPPPPGRYYPRYVPDQGTYPSYLPHIESGLINNQLNEDVSQYPGIAGPLGGPEPTLNEYQQVFTDENPSEHRLDTFSFGMSVPRSMPISQPQETVWPNTNNIKCSPLFNYDEMANNLSIAMPQTNGDVANLIHGLESIRMNSRLDKPAPTDQDEDDQELEKELLALEQRISTEFSKASDQIDTDAEE